VSTDDDSARQAAFAAAGSLDPNRLDIVIERQGGAGTPATVTVQYRAPIAVPAVGWLFPSEVDLEGTAVMRQETE
jgi:hypothetical protein